MTTVADLDRQAVAAIEHALGQLAELEPPAIAARLLAAGARGKRSYCGRCPLAVYLRRLADREVLVYSSNVAIRGRDYRYRTVTLPESVAAFVAYFDGGQFRALRA